MKRDRHEIKLLKEIGIEAKRKAVKLEIPFYKYVENLIKEDLEKDGVVFGENEEENHIFSKV